MTALLNMLQNLEADLEAIDEWVKMSQVDLCRLEKLLLKATKGDEVRLAVRGNRAFRGPNPYQCLTVRHTEKEA